MGLLLEEVEVALNGSNIKYYEDKGYNIPKYFNQKYNYFYAKMGEKITVKTTDLPNGSHIKVMFECDECHMVKEMLWSSYCKRYKNDNYEYFCKKCSNKNKKKNIVKRPSCYSNERKWCVYIHKCPNGKRYVGITSQEPEKRWQNGFGYKGQIFYNAIEKYGWDNIEHYIIFTNLTELEACSKEKFLIKYYNTYIHSKDSMGYNSSLGGESSCGYIPSDEQRKKHSEFMTGSNNPMYGKKQSQESINKRVNTLKRKIQNGEILIRKGYNRSEEFKENLSRQRKGKGNPMYGKTSPTKGKKHSEESRIKMRNNSNISIPILCEGIEYHTINLCADHYNIKHSTMRTWLNGQNPMPIEWKEKGLMYKDENLRSKTRYK